MPGEGLEPTPSITSDLRHRGVDALIVVERREGPEHHASGVGRGDRRVVVSRQIAKVGQHVIAATGMGARGNNRSAFRIPQW